MVTDPENRTSKEIGSKVILDQAFEGSIWSVKGSSDLGQMPNQTQIASSPRQTRRKVNHRSALSLFTLARFISMTDCIDEKSRYGAMANDRRWRIETTQRFE